MEDWTGGYITDVGYTFGYYTELNPHLLKLAFLNHGLVFPRIKQACELGYGQGVSTNIHAAASDIKWYGTDFNPSQAAYAKELAEQSGNSANLYDDAFADFANRKDLPDFDYIALHGIWSWISDDNRHVIVDFIRRKLKVGGILYISYNTQPGWAGMVPMRELLVEHASTMSAAGSGINTRISSSLDFADRLMELHPLYAKANPQVEEHLKKMKGLGKSYLAHEYFNQYWQPMTFSVMAGWLEQAKLTYACSAHYIDHIESLNLTAEQQIFIKQIPDPKMRELARDFCTNQQFRRDYWVRGLRKMNLLAQMEALRKYKVVMVRPYEDLTFKVNGALGKADLQESSYGPILDLLRNYQPMSLGAIEETIQKKSLKFASIVQTVMILYGMGIIQYAQDETEIKSAKQTSTLLNQDLITKSRGSNGVMYLASPVTGGGISVPQIEQLFLWMRSQGYDKVDWPRIAWNILSSEGHKLSKDGVPLESQEDNIAEAEILAEHFISTKLSLLIAHGLA